MLKAKAYYQLSPHAQLPEVSFRGEFVRFFSDASGQSAAGKNIGAKSNANGHGFRVQYNPDTSQDYEKALPTAA